MRCTGQPQPSRCSPAPVGCPESSPWAPSTRQNPTTTEYWYTAPCLPPQPPSANICLRENNTFTSLPSHRPLFGLARMRPVQRGSPGKGMLRCLRPTSTRGGGTELCPWSPKLCRAPPSLPGHHCPESRTAALREPWHSHRAAPRSRSGPPVPPPARGDGAKSLLHQTIAGAPQHEEIKKQ